MNEKEMKIKTYELGRITEQYSNLLPKFMSKDFEEEMVRLVLWLNSISDEDLTEDIVGKGRDELIAFVSHHITKLYNELIGDFGVYEYAC